MRTMGALNTLHREVSIRFWIRFSILFSDINIFFFRAYPSSVILNLTTVECRRVLRATSEYYCASVFDDLLFVYAKSDCVLVRHLEEIIQQTLLALTTISSLHASL